MARRWLHARRALIVLGLAGAGPALAAASTDASTCASTDGRTAPDLLPYEIVDDTVPAPLTARTGDPVAGKAVFLDRERGHCLLCHAVTSIEAPFHGTIGPALSAVADRLSAGQMRYRIIDPTRLNPDTVMPSYYRVAGLVQVGAAYRDRPILTAQEIEDLVAYLMTLTGPPGGENNAR